MLMLQSLTAPRDQETPEEFADADPVPYSSEGGSTP